MTTGPRTRVDMHCHSSASELSRLGVQRAAGLPECATPPQEVYELAKRRGMDFVTITDHDTIDGVLQIAHLPDVFVSEELTAHFRGEPQSVHVLCEPDAGAMAEALLKLARSPALRTRLSAAGWARVRERTWERTLERLASGYRRALGDRLSHSAQEDQAA